MKNWGLIGNEKTIEKDLFLEQMNLKVFCDICDKELKQSIFKDTYVFRCNHRNTKIRNKINIPYSNVVEAVINTLEDLSHSLDINYLQKICIAKLHSKLNTLNNEISSLNSKISKLDSNIILSFENHKFLMEKLSTHQKLEKEMEELLSAKNKVKEWILDIKQFSKLCIQSSVYDYIQKNPHEAAQFLIHSIRLSNVSIDILHYFDGALKEVN